MGKIGGQQIVALERPTKRSLKCFRSVGKPIHELLHALGVFHEQSRADRDNYVKIMFDNILPGISNILIIIIIIVIFIIITSNLEGVE